MSTRLALLALSLLLLGLLLLIISGAVREVVVIPLLYLLWLMRVLVEMLPQVVLWVGFLAILALVAWKSLAVPPAAPLLRQSAPTVRTPVAAWARMFQSAANERYARWQLAQRLGKLGLELLASRDQPARQGVWQYLHDEALDMPPEVRAYLLEGTQMYHPLATFWQRWWPWGIRPRPQTDPLDLDLEVVVQWLEQQLNRLTGANL
jgi:hypothetical protein